MYSDGRDGARSEFQGGVCLAPSLLGGLVYEYESIVLDLTLRQHYQEMCIEYENSGLNSIEEIHRDDMDFGLQ